MPKSYSEQEREYIRKRLKDKAAKCLATYGVRRTTVDEIVKRTNIAKGTFYLFYQSKEQLLFEVILEQHDLIERSLYEEIKDIDISAPLAEQLTEIILHFYKLAGEMPVLKLLNSGEIELLARKLPAGVLEEHFGYDNKMIERVFSELPIKAGTNPAVFSAAFRAIFLVTLHKEEIGEESFDEALRLLISGLVTQLI